MRKLVVFIALAISLSSLGAVPTMYLRGAVEGSYLTNVFSDPLPINASESYLEDIEFIKRWNAGAALTFDTFFDDSYPAGLSFNAVFRFPITSETIYHDGSSYVSYDSLSSQRIGIFLGIGPVFRGRFGIVDIGLTLRASLGSYDYFVSGLIIEHLDLVAVRLAPAGVHAQEHGRPVERLRTARTGIDIHDGPHLVLVAAQHVAQLQRLDVLHRAGIMFIHFGFGDDPLLQKFGHQFQILHLLGDRIVVVDPTLDGRHTTQLLARLRGMLPKVGFLRLLLFVLQIYAFTVDVKGTSPTQPDVLQPL